MTTAATFIKERIAEFGLLGVNNRVPDDLERAPLPAIGCQFTKDNHFRFGFDDGEFNSRTCASSTYWAEYGRPSRDHRGFIPELCRALAEVHEIHGALGVTNSGNFTNRAVLAAAKQMGLRVEQVTVEIEGHSVPAQDPEMHHCRYVVTWDGLVEFAETFARVAGCADPWIALEAYHGHVSSTPHIYSSARLHLVNHSYDRARKDIIGPAVWTIAEYEQATSIDRWLLAERRSGIPRIMFWSPELIAAQLDSATWRDRIRRASAWPPELEPGNIRLSAYALCRQAFPNVRMARSAEEARNDAALNQKMAQLRLHLSRTNPGCNTTHHLPLHRVLARLRLAYNFPFDRSEATYGRVDE
jgi:hypothetical protein